MHRLATIDPARPDAGSPRPDRSATSLARLAVSTLLALLVGCDRAAPASQAAMSTPRAATAGDASEAGGPARPPASPPSAMGAGSTPRFAADDRGDGALLPAAIARGLQTDQRVLECAAGTRDGVSQFAPGWVGVRRIDLDGDGRDDWIVNGLHACLRVDGTPAWWVYVDHADGIRLALAAQPAVGLRVLPTRSDGLRDLSVERGDGQVVTLQVDGGRYVAVPADTASPTTGASRAR